MNFIVGDRVTYRSLIGVVSFVSSDYISILISEGEHRSQDVNIVVYVPYYKEVHYQDEK